MKRNRIMDAGYVAPILVEDMASRMDELKKDDKGRDYLLKFRSIVAIIGEENGNKRLFTEKLYEDRIFKNDDCVNRVKNGRVVGQLGHPEGAENPKEEKITYVFDELYSEKRGGKLFALGVGRVADTFYGRIAYGLHKAGVTLGFSVRGLGGAQVTDGTEVIDEEDFYLEGYDAVLSPAVLQAFPDVIESKDEKINFDEVFEDEKTRKVAMAIYDKLKDELRGNNMPLGKRTDGDLNQGAPEPGVIAEIKANFAGSEIEQTFDKFQEWIKASYPHLIGYTEMLWAGPKADVKKKEGEEIVDEKPDEKPEEKPEEKDGEGNKSEEGVEDESKESYIGVISDLTQENYEMKKIVEGLKTKLLEVDKEYKKFVKEDMVRNMILEDNIKATEKLVEIIHDMDEQIEEAQEQVERLKKELGEKDEGFEVLKGEKDSLEESFKKNQKVLRMKMSQNEKLSLLEEDVKRLKLAVSVKDALLELPASKRVVAEKLLDTAKEEKEVKKVLDDVRRGRIDPTVFDDVSGIKVKEDEESLTEFLLKRTL